MAPLPVVEKNAMSRPAKVTALADGKIYLFTSINATTRKAPWRVLTNCYTTCAMDVTKNGETKSVLRGTFYIVEREVKAGEVVEIPTFKNKWGVCVLAKTIEY